MHLKLNFIGRYILLIIFCLFLTISSYTQSDEFNNIKQLWEKSSIMKLSQHFDKRIQLILPQVNGKFSNRQATVILKDFIKANPVSELKEIKTEGINGKRWFCILEYRSGRSTLKILYQIRQIEQKYYITEIQIKKNNDD